MFLWLFRESNHRHNDPTITYALRPVVLRPNIEHIRGVNHMTIGFGAQQDLWTVRVNHA